MNRRYFLRLLSRLIIALVLGFVDLFKRSEPKWWTERDKLALDIVHRVLPNHLIDSLVSVQPLPGPIGQVFYLDYGRGQV